MTLDDVVKGSIKKKTLTKDGVEAGLDLHQEVFHHEWARAKKTKHTVCIIAAGISPLAFVMYTLQEQVGYKPDTPITEKPFELYIHDLDGKTFGKLGSGDELDFIDT